MTLKMGILEYIANIVTAFFLMVIVSYYILIFIKPRKVNKEKSFSSISVIITAHNEESYIKEAIESVKAAEFKGNKEIIIVDDGSNDKTAEISSEYISKNIKLLRTSHNGKSASINKALRIAKGELIAIVDGDSYVHKDALMEIIKKLEGKNVVGASGVIKVKNRNKFICGWLHVEQVYYSLIRLLITKINANITTPGPLSVYRKKELIEVGGFSTEGFAEDADITIRLIRKGYKIEFAEKAIVETNMPHQFKWFFRQRSRFARGTINILKRHMKANTKMIDIYTLPILLFSYAQAVIMGLWILYQILSGYVVYFVSKGAYFNIYVLKFFFEWFSIIGTVRWLINVFSSQTSLNLTTIIGVLSSLLTYPLLFLALYKFDKLSIRNLLTVFFMFPFWLLVMGIYTISLPEYFRKRQYNIWKKNE